MQEDEASQILHDNLDGGSKTRLEGENLTVRPLR